MNTIGHNSIVVGIDGSASSDTALGWGIQEASRRHLPLYLLRALERELPVEAGLRDTPGTAEVMRLQARELTQELLTTRAALVTRTAPALTVSVEAADDFAAAALIDLSHHADSIVLGNRGYGVLMGKLLGSVSTEVSTYAHCPVVVLGEHLHDRKGRRGVVVGVDGSSGSAEALAYAFEQASTRRVPLDVVHAWKTTVPAGLTVERLRQEQTLQHLELSESLAGWCEKYPDVAISAHLPVGAPVHTLLEQAKHAELLVVGNRGVGGFRRLVLGSVSHGVLQHAHCPVAVVGSQAA